MPRVSDVKTPKTKDADVLMYCMRRHFVALLSIVILWPIVNAVVASTGIPSGIDQDEAESFIRALSSQAARSLSSHDLSDTKRIRYFQELLAATIDLETIGRFVLGRHWRKATEVERLEFLKLFEDITVYTWSKRFMDYSDQGLTVIRVRPEEGDTVVESTLRQPQQGAPLSVLWRLRRSEKGIRVTDIVVEGVSMAVTYRSEYSAVIQHSGSVAGLLVILRAKIDALKNP